MGKYVPCFKLQKRSCLHKNAWLTVMIFWMDLHYFTIENELVMGYKSTNLYLNKKIMALQRLSPTSNLQAFITT